MNLKLISALTLLISIISVLLLSFVPEYNYHLRTDIFGQYFANANSFLQNKNLSNQPYNEYQPIAVLFFILLSPLLTVNWFSPLPHINYTYGIYTANIIFIVLNAFLVFKITKSYFNVILFSLIILFAGPIILHRFELLLFVFIYLSIYFFTKKQYALFGFFIAISILTKIFPIIYFPYFLILIYKNKQKWVNLVNTLGGFVLGITSTLFIYCVVLRASFNKIFSDLQIHSIKPLHAESVYASFVTFFNYYVEGIRYIGKGRDGIFGINDLYIYLPLNFYNYFWIVPIGISILFLFFYTKENSNFSAKIPFLLMCLYLIFSKILTSQYLLWFMLFLPLINIKAVYKSNVFAITVFLCLLALLISQYIYPLRYNELLGVFFASGGYSEIFILLLIRNTLIIVIFFINTAYLIKKLKAVKLK